MEFDVTDNINYEISVSALLAVAYNVSPTGTEQQAFSRLINQMRKNRETEKSIVLTLLGSISDGIKHGNWPREPMLYDGCDRTDKPVSATHDGRALLCNDCQEKLRKGSHGQV